VNGTKVFNQGLTIVIGGFLWIDIVYPSDPRLTFYRSPLDNNHQKVFAIHEI